jgi:hypothetical protein
VLRFRYPANAYYQRFRDTDGQEHDALPEPEPAALAVYRRGFVVWRMDLTPAMAGLLEALCSGATLGAALAGIAAHAEGPEALAEAERNVMAWFGAWVSGGFFARIEWNSPDGAGKKGKEGTR